MIDLNKKDNLFFYHYFKTADKKRKSMCLVLKSKKIKYK